MVFTFFKGLWGKKIVDDVTLTDLALVLTGQSSLDLNELSGQSLKIYHWALFRSSLLRAFPGGLVVRTLCSHCPELGFNPWLGN